MLLQLAGEYGYSEGYKDPNYLTNNLNYLSMSVGRGGLPLNHATSPVPEHARGGRARIESRRGWTDRRGGRRGTTRNGDSE